jgi:hypothetical protein
VLRLDVELLHGADYRLCTVDDVLIDRKPIHGELVSGISILMNDLHLFDNGGLSAFAGAYGQMVSSFLDLLGERCGSSYREGEFYILVVTVLSLLPISYRWPDSSSSAPDRRRLCSYKHPWFLV